MQMRTLDMKRFIIKICAKIIYLMERGKYDISIIYQDKKHWSGNRGSGCEGGEEDFI